MKRVDTVCTYCGVGCDISAIVEEGRIVKVYAQKEGVVSRGNLCVKGRYGHDYLYHPDRLDRALIKKSFAKKDPICDRFRDRMSDYDDSFYSIDYEAAYEIVALKLSRLKNPESFAAIGGARTSCESSYFFQKFAREVIGSPHVDNCARVCHSPSLRGMRATIGEGAATNPFDDIYLTDNIVIIGSNTTEAHPIVANRVIERVRKGASLHVVDVRKIPIGKFADQELTIPYESNLMILNMIARIIVEKGWYDEKFIAERTKGFDEYKKLLMSDPYSDPELLEKMAGYEDLREKIEKLAEDLAFKKSMILWGLGVTEHVDGSYAVMAITHLALLTANVGLPGAGLMPLRGQNNVQGTCDMGMLPYYLPDYRKPEKDGLMTPDIIDAILRGEIKAIFNMGEDIAHIHPNQNKIHKALEKLDFLVVNEIFPNQITRYADVVFGVKSAYEKVGVYVNAERRLHLSAPLVESDLPDDWEVLHEISKRLGKDFGYSSSEDIWNEVRKEAPERFSGASYEKLKKDPLRGLQWPVKDSDTPILHTQTFRTADGYGHFKYRSYSPREMVKALLDCKEYRFYLTTGRIMAHYNNAAQTAACERLAKRYPEDILLVSEEDREFFKGAQRVVLVSRYGKSAPLKIKFSDTIKRGTLYTTFHHAASKINYLFGDEADEFVKTARFKSVKVDIEF